MGRFTVMKVVRALLARLIFALHSCIALWRLYMEDQQIHYWLFGLIPILLFIEGAVTILLRNGDEYKWFCPCIFIYLCGSIPPIWFLELTNTRNYIANYTRSDVTNEYIEIGGNVKVDLPRIPRQYWLQVVEQSLLIIVIIGRWILPKGQISRDQLSQLLLAYLAISSDIVELFDLFNERDVRNSMSLSLIVLTVWTVSMIQFPLVITTMKGQKARFTWQEGGGNAKRAPTEEEIVFNFKFDDSMRDSVYQPKPTPAPDPIVKIKRAVVWAKQPDENEKEAGALRNPLSLSLASMDMSLLSGESKVSSAAIRMKNKVCRVSVWGILSTVFIQDGPFLGLRLYLIFAYHVMSYTMVFFTCKNTLIVMLQLYRLMVICCDSGKAKKRRRNLQHANNPQRPLHKTSAPACPNKELSKLLPIHRTHSNPVNKIERKIVDETTNNSAATATHKTKSMICSMEDDDFC